jgi:hypothetical protein
MVEWLGYNIWKEGSNAFFQTLNEPITNTDCIALLRGKGPDSIHHTLVVFNDGHSYWLSIRAGRGLANVLKGSMRLVAVTREQLRKNRRAYLLEAKL